MSTFSTSSEWDPFLRTFSAACGVADWPGNIAATEEQLSAAETRLKTKLPPSYRAFLATSNGWRNASREVPMLRPVQKVRWFGREHRDWVQAYTQPMRGIEPLLPAETEYFNYHLQDNIKFETKHLRQTLCVSEFGDDAVLLLNPMVIWPDGEWEAWLFANWLPGALRYRSFAEWMRHELAKLQGEAFIHSLTPGELPTVYLDGPAKGQRRIRPREEILSFDEAVKGLTSKTQARRVKAVRQIGRIGGQLAVNTLIESLKDDPDKHVRCEAAAILGQMRAQDAIEPLMAAGLEKSFATACAIQALGNFQDEISANGLLRLVEEDGPSAAVAVYALARRNDPRAVAPLVKKLVSKAPRDQHTGNIAGRYIALFEEPGYLALEPLAMHEDLETRTRAIVGVSDMASLAKDKILRHRACQLLQQCLERETDARMHECLVGYVAFATNKRTPRAENPFAGPFSG